jgi:hypothetical protein
MNASLFPPDVMTQLAVLDETHAHRITPASQLQARLDELTMTWGFCPWLLVRTKEFASRTNLEGGNPV